MPNVESRLIVTIDTECDKLPNWRTAAPLSFRAVTEAIPDRLHPLFARYGVRPTYLLSPEVITDPDSVAVLKALGDCELSTHLHGDYILPQIKTWDIAGTITDEMQWEYGYDLELAKMAGLTELFRQQFGRQPLSFRSGRFGAGPHTGKILQELGYKVDSSVTPHICWTSRKGERRPDYRGYHEMPYTMGVDGDIANSGYGGLLELPVTILPTGTVQSSNPVEPIWFRPWYSDADSLCRVLDYVLDQPKINGTSRPLVMMFHNVELLAGASPYPQSEVEVQRYLDTLARVFDLAEKRGVRASTMAEYAAYYAAEGRLDSMAGSATNIRFATSNSTGQMPIVGPVFDLEPKIHISPELVEAVLIEHGVRPWFKYIFHHRADRWDVVNPCRWIAENVKRDAPILSVGAGVGFNLFWLAERGFSELWGSDVDPAHIAAGQDIARRTGLPVSLFVSDALSPMRMGPEKYSAIEALNCTMYMAEFTLRRFLEIYVPQLSPDGVLIFDAIDASFNEVFDNEYLTSDLDKPVAERRPSEYSVRILESEVRAEFAALGLDVIKTWEHSERVPRKVYIGRLRGGRSVKAPTQSEFSQKQVSGLATRLPKILIIADVENWIFDRHAQKIRTELSGVFDIDIKYQGHVFSEDDYDLVHPLEWNLVPLGLIKHPKKWITGIRSHISWEQLDFQQFCEVLRTKFGSVYVVSQRLLSIFAPSLPGLQLLAHGVDTEHFRPASSPSAERGRLRVGWAGNRKSPAKGFETYVEPLGGLPGVDLIFCGYSDRLMGVGEMPGFYEAIDVYVCSSSTEGHNNSLMEAAAMARAIVTTDVGTVPEYLIDGETALIVPRSPSAFVDAIVRLRDQPELRVAMGVAARSAVLAKFDWRDRMDDHRVYFQAAIDHFGKRSFSQQKLNGYSFCIITNGKREDKLNREIDSILQLQIPFCEILVGGELPPGFSRSDVRVVGVADAARNGRLGEMRNALCRAARYDHLVVSDDDMVFHPDFYAGLQAHGEDFDVLCVRMLNPDGSRHWDWCTHGGPTGHHLLAYEAVDPHVYVTGGLCVMKSAVFDRVQWDEGRGFYQGEDLDFSARLKHAGVRIHFCAGSTVTHDDSAYTQVGTVVFKCPVFEVVFDISVLLLGQINDRARTGIYRFTENLLAGLASRTDVRLKLVAHPNLLGISSGYLLSHPLFAGRFEVYDLNKLQATELLHSPYFPFPVGSHFGPRILTVHDLISINFPEFFESADSDSLRQGIESLTSDDFITVNSSATKADLCHYAPHICPDQITTTPLAADSKIFFPCRSLEKRDWIFAKYIPGFEGNYLLSVATLEPRKNIAFLIKCFSRLLKENDIPDLKLVLVGVSGWKFTDIFDELAVAEDIRSKVVLTGFVPDEDMSALYSNALIFIYPSLYEGFGLPPLEAMQCGTPVITSNNSSLPEVVGDAGIMVRADDADALVHAIRSLYSNEGLRRDMSERGIARAARFTWDQCVENTVFAYKMAYAHWQVKQVSLRTMPQPIVIDAVFFQLYQTGIARVWRSLLQEWAGTPFGKRLIILNRGRTAPHIEGIRYVDIPRYDYSGTDADRAMLQRVCDVENAALFISSYYTTPLTTPSVFMAHDMIPELLGADLTGNPMWREKHFGIRHARHFLAVSGNTARDLKRFCPDISPDQITVTHNGVDFKTPSAEHIAVFCRENHIQRPYFLLVGARDGYKNGILFFKAFAALGAARSRYAIVCTGPAIQLEAEYAPYVGDAAVHMLNLSEVDLQAAYGGALALIYPSLYEGFGMPIVEAMACSCPVITTRRGAISEVAGDAALYVEPEDAKEMLRALKHIQKPHVRKQFVTLGLKRASLYSWQKMANEVRVVLERVAANAVVPSTPPAAREQLLAVAFQAHQHGQLELAESSYRELLKAFPNDFVGVHMLGVVRHQRGDTVEAEQLLKLALTINDLTPEAHYNLGNVYVSQGRLVLAQASFQQALSLNSNFTLAQQQLAAVTS